MVLMQCDMYPHAERKNFLIENGRHVFRCYGFWNPESKYRGLEPI